MLAIVASVLQLVAFRGLGAELGLFAVAYSLLVGVGFGYLFSSALDTAARMPSGVDAGVMGEMALHPAFGRGARPVRQHGGWRDVGRGGGRGARRGALCECSAARCGLTGNVGRLVSPACAARDSPATQVTPADPATAAANQRTAGTRLERRTARVRGLIAL